MVVPNTNRTIEIDAVHDRTFPITSTPEETITTVTQRMRATENQRRAVLTLIDEQRDKIISCLQELIRIPSVNPSPEGEKALADYVAAIMQDINMEVQQIEPASNRVSNLGVLKGSKNDRSLLYYAHLDTVQPGDPSEWTHPPFSGEMAEGRIWGRGAKDCKLGIASSLMAAWAIQEASIELEGDLQIVTPADEESGGYLGLAQMIAQGMIQADWAIYGEGRPESITIGHRGNVKVLITTKGKTAHSAWKTLGDNAIIQMCKLAPYIESIEYKGWEPHPIVPGNVVGSVNIIDAGTSENVVPDRCTISVDVRFPPGVTARVVLEQMQETIDWAKQQHPEIGDVTVELGRYGRPSFIPAELPLVKYMKESMKDVLKEEPEAKGMMASSDSRWLVLDAGIPTVNFSMGNDSGHRPNEWAGVEDLIDTTKVYASMALLLLGE